MHNRFLSADAPMAHISSPDSGHHLPRSVVFALCTLMLTACAGLPRVDRVKEVHLCASGECGLAGKNRNASEMLNGIYQLLKHNEDKTFKICESNRSSRNCTKEGIGYFVMGGLVPGRGSASESKMTGVQVDPNNHTITATVSSYLKFEPLFLVSAPMKCVDHQTTITVRSADEIVMIDKNYYCRWMILANMIASFNVAIDYVDLDKGRLGGYWKHAVAGIGVGGKGKGYSIFQFPVKMAKGENWLKPVKEQLPASSNAP